MTQRKRRTAGLLAGSLLVAIIPPALATEAEDARTLLQEVAAALCPAAVESPRALEAALPQLALGDVKDVGPGDAWLRREIRWQDRDRGLAVVVTALRPGGVLRRLDIAAETLSDARPLLLALSDPDCRILQGRALRYDDGGAAELLVLAADLARVRAREPLNPPVPPRGDTPPPRGSAAGVAIAHLDSGVNYLLPEIATSLARDEAGRFLGYDFWDIDGRPFDADTARSPFFPLRHGTRVASLMLREAPGVRLLPLRYPRPDMARMAEAVGLAERAGATIVALPMGSNDASLWTTFAEAARARPEMLFIVSAGNNGRDIDAVPLYPASLPLDNMIVVTSAGAAGHPAPGSNWGARSVDLLVPAEAMAVTDFDGTPGQGSGSSFAVPRVAALAARLKAAHPDWQAAELKQAIFARAIAPPGQGRGAVAVGWLPDPLAVSD